MLLRHAIPALLALGLLASPAFAQDEPAAPSSGGAVVTKNPDGTTTVSPAAPEERSFAQDPSRAKSVMLNFPPDSSIMQWVQFFAETRQMNFIISDLKELEGKRVTLISYDKVSPDAAWEAFMSALQVTGYSISITGRTAKIVKSTEAAANPIRIGQGQPAESDAYVTQLIQLENTRVDDMSKIVQGMVGPDAKIVSYPPTNTIIVTDTAANIRKLYRLMKELDVASPRSTMEIYTLRFAAAADVKAIIEELYGTAADDSTPAPAPTRSSRTSRSRSRRTPEPSSESVSAGEASKFIAKVIDDERTNALIVLANEDGHVAVEELIGKVDVDVAPQGEIHVVYLEHAKAEEVQQVLSNLSQGGAGASSARTPAQQRRQQQNGRTGAGARATSNARSAAGGDEDSEGGSALAAFDSGMRIAPDEATNSLVIIANNDDFKVIYDVIKKLDIVRKQVYVDAVVMELSSEDASSIGLAAHLPQQPTRESAGFIGAQLGANSLGLTPDALSGLALGVFGESVNVPIVDPTGTGGTINLPVPAFGIVLNALKTSGSTNIISNPSLMTLDNEEATFIVGRKVPFPTTSGMSQFGLPITSFQREDVAITMKIVPRVNSANFVTLELEVEVQEVEESAQSAASAQAGGGPITSQRKLDTVAMVADNETMVIGGLVGSTDGTTENKVPVLGDIPLVGALFRSKNTTKRKTNLLIFLTPHIIDEPSDIIEIQRVKEAQRQEFLRRFYGKSRDEFWQEIQSLMRYSMNFIDEPSMYRGPDSFGTDLRLDGIELSDESKEAIQQALDEAETELPDEVTPPESTDSSVGDGGSAPEDPEPAPEPVPDPLPEEP